MDDLCSELERNATRFRRGQYPSQSLDIDVTDNERQDAGGSYVPLECQGERHPHRKTPDAQILSLRSAKLAVDATLRDL